MRLFYALTFDRPSRTKLHHLATDLAPTPAMGRTVDIEQLHLTLLFLGEVDHEAVGPLASALTLLPPLPTRYQCSGIGSFFRRGGSILWAGVEPSAPLLEANRILVDATKNLGLAVDTRPLAAHITVVRKGRITTLPTVKPFVLNAEAVVLMHSHQERGQLTYTPLASYPL